MNIMNITILAIVLLICFIAFNKKANAYLITPKILNKGADLLDNKKIYMGIIILLFIIGTVVRLYKYPEYPLGFNQDGAMGAVDAKALADYGTDRFGMQLPVLFQAWGYGSMSVLLSYLTVPLIKIFGFSPLIARLPMMIVSLLAMYVLYSLSRKIWGDKAAIAVLGFVALNPWQFMQSRWALDCNMLPHFLLFSVFFLYKGLTEKKIYLYLSMFFFALTMYTYGIALYSIPLFLVILCIYLLVKKEINFKNVLICVGCYLVLAWPMFVMLYLNIAEKPSIVTPLITIPSYFQTNARIGDILFFSENVYDQLVTNVNYFFNIVVFQTEDLPWNTIKDYGTVYMFSMPFVITGLVFIVKNIRKSAERKIRLGSSVILIWLIVAVISGLIINRVNVNRINIVFYPVLIFAGLGIYEIIKRFKPSVIFLSVVYVMSFSMFLGSYFGESGDYLGFCFYDGYSECIQTAEECDNEKIYIGETVTLRYRDTTEILTLFHLNIDAEYFQGKKDSYNDDGEKLLPYKERYRYVNFDTYMTDISEDAVYVINSSDLKNFETEKYKMKQYKDYILLIPLAEYQTQTG